MNNNAPVQERLLIDLLNFLKTSFVTDSYTIQTIFPISQKKLEIYAEQIELLLKNTIILDKDKIIENMLSTKKVSKLEGSSLTKFKYDFNFHLLALLDTNIVENCFESAEKYAEDALKERLKSEIEREFGYKQ